MTFSKWSGLIKSGGSLLALHFRRGRRTAPIHRKQESSAPASWPDTPGATTVDGSVTWVYAGPLPTAAVQVSGGTSGIIMDNVVSSTTMAGASQVYFSTLSNQACTTSSTGGCAASQSALQ